MTAAHPVARRTGTAALFVLLLGAGTVRGAGPAAADPAATVHTGLSPVRAVAPGGVGGGRLVLGIGCGVAAGVVVFLVLLVLLVLLGRRRQARPPAGAVPPPWPAVRTPSWGAEPVSATAPEAWQVEVGVAGERTAASAVQPGQVGTGGSAWVSAREARQVSPLGGAAEQGAASRAPQPAPAQVAAPSPETLSSADMSVRPGAVPAGRASSAHMSAEQTPVWSVTGRLAGPVPVGAGMRHDAFFEDVPAVPTGVPAEQSDPWTVVPAGPLGAVVPLPATAGAVLHTGPVRPARKSTVDVELVDQIAWLPGDSASAEPAGPALEPGPVSAGPAREVGSAGPAPEPELVAAGPATASAVQVWADAWASSHRPRERSTRLPAEAEDEAPPWGGRMAAPSRGGDAGWQSVATEGRAR